MLASEETESLKRDWGAREIAQSAQETVHLENGEDIALGGAKAENGKGVVSPWNFDKPALVSQFEHPLVECPGMADINNRVGVAMNQKGWGSAL